MKKFLFILILTLPVVNLLAQNSLKKVNNSSEPTYDIAPGKRLPAKFEVIDYSYKLEGIQQIDSVKKEFRFYDNFDEKAVVDMKDVNSDEYEYYQRLKIYYDGLSNRVKTIFTFNEIWHVFVFDPELKSKLKTID